MVPWIDIKSEIEEDAKKRNIAPSWIIKCDDVFPNTNNGELLQLCEEFLEKTWSVAELGSDYYECQLDRSLDGYDIKDYLPDLLEQDMVLSYVDLVTKIRMVEK